MRAAPRVAEIQTALGAISVAAENGDQSAKTMLQGFFEAWRRAEAAASGIVIPTTGAPQRFEAPTRKEGWSIDNEPKSGV